MGILSSIDVYVTYGIDDSKLTTTSDGRYVRIRGNNPGGHLWRSLQRKIEEQKVREQEQAREQIERQRREREQQRERERQRTEMELQMEIERQRREMELQMEKERHRRVRIQ